MGAYTKFLDMFETLYSRRLYSSLHLRWNKPFMPRLAREEIGITAVPSVHAKAERKKSVVTESAKHRLEGAVRMTESLSNNIYFIRRSKMRRGGCKVWRLRKLLHAFLPAGFNQRRTHGQTRGLINSFTWCSAVSNTFLGLALWNWWWYF